MYSSAMVLFLLGPTKSSSAPCSTTIIPYHAGSVLVHNESESGPILGLISSDGNGRLVNNLRRCFNNFGCVS